MEKGGLRAAEVARAAGEAELIIGNHDSSDFYRLSVGREVRLRYAYFITCTSVVKDKCDYKNTCTFVADPDLLGDDDRYCIKSTGITYRCTNGVPMAGGGSGGRVAAYYHTSYFTGTWAVEGGRSFNEPGSSGTAYLERYAHVNGTGLTEEVRTGRPVNRTLYMNNLGQEGTNAVRNISTYYVTRNVVPTITWILLENEGVGNNMTFDSLFIYGAAKLAQVGLMQTLALEGAKHNIHVNALAPTAATRMTEGLMPQEVLDALKPEAVVPAMLVLAHESAPTRTILCAGAGTFEAAHITLTQGVHLGIGSEVPEHLAARLAEVTNRAGEQVPQSGAAQGTNEVAKAMAAR